MLTPCQSLHKSLHFGLLLLLAALGGCQDGGMSSLLTGRPQGMERIDKLQLVLTPPAPLNWDGRPGVDGFLARLYCWCPLESKLAVPVNGTLEVALYEGRCSAGELPEKKPFHVWTFRENQTGALMSKTLFGWGYSLELGWGDHVPLSPTVTLQVRHRSRGGRVTLSDPVNVAMGPT